MLRHISSPFFTMLPLFSPFVGLAAFKIIIGVVKKKNNEKKEHTLGSR